MWNTSCTGGAGSRCTPAIKVIPTDAGEVTVMIIGLSGTGKTTTTFTTQNGSLPVQDDFVALMPGGVAYGTEERLLREDVLARPRLRAEHLQRRRGAERLPRTRLRDDDGKVNSARRAIAERRAVFQMSDLARYRDASISGRSTSCSS